MNAINKSSAIRDRIKQIARDSNLGRIEDFKHFTTGDLQAIIHEFGLYQAELEAQNEEIRQSQSEAEAARGRFELLYDCSPAGYMTLDGKGVVVEVNATMCGLLREKKGKVIGRPFTSYLDRSSADAFHLVIRKLMRYGGRDLSMYRFRNAPGRWFQAESVPFAPPDEDIRILCMVTDRTDRENALLRLGKSEAKLHLALESAKAGCWEWDVKTGENVWSEELWRLYMLDPKRHSPSYESWLASVRAEDRPEIDRLVKADAASGKDINLEWPVESSPGQERWLMSRGKAQRDTRGKVVSYLGIVLDVTERKINEKALLKSLHEQEMLLKEVHHRVKNNLQILDSLMSLQAEGHDDPRISEAFLVMRNRIRSIFLVHERLYRSEDLGAVDMKAYIEELVLQIARSYNASSIGAVVDINAGDYRLGLDKAIPLGLLLTELVSNAFKHALRSRPGGRLGVELVCQDNTCRLSVCDNGPGLPEGFHLDDASSMGMQLISALAGQLGGKASASSRNGANFVVVFPEHEEVPVP